MNKHIFLPCNCGCCALEVEHHFDDEYGICFYVRSFYAKQETWFSILKRRAKLALNILRGQEYCLHDVCVTRAELEQFSHAIQNLLKESI